MVRARGAGAGKPPTIPCGRAATTLVVGGSCPGAKSRSTAAMPMTLRCASLVDAADGTIAALHESPQPSDFCCLTSDSAPIVYRR